MLLVLKRRTTPSPAINRPTTNVAQRVSSCKPTPRQNIKQDATIPHLRPTISPIGNAKSAPKKVPAERIDTYQVKEKKKKKTPQIKKEGTAERKLLTTRLLLLTGR